MDFTALETEIAANESVDESAKLLITRLAEEIEANGADATKMAELAARLRTANESLGAAVAAVPPATP